MSTISNKNAVHVVILLLIMNGSVHELSAQGFKKTFKANGRVIEVTELNERIEAILDEASVPGLSFAVIEGNDVVFYNAYGYRKIEGNEGGKVRGSKVNKRTVFEACSLSKSFFVFAVQTLVDRGLLDLDMPLYKYLSHPSIAYDDRYQKITARMVLTHSSGLENWKSENEPDKLEIVNEPGETFVYSGEGYVYLARVVEKILGKSTEDYMKELVIEPLRLKRTFTTFSENGRSPSNFGLGHDGFMLSSPKEKNTAPNIAGMITTTAEDYAKLLIAIFNSDYLSKERVADITRSGTKIGDHIYWGQGFAVYSENGDTLVYQHGNNGVFKGFGFYSVTRKSGFVMFVNGEHGNKINRVLDSLTVNCNIFDKEGQYPNPVFQVLNVYNDQGYPASLNFFKHFVSEGNFISNTDFQNLGYLFLKKEPEFSDYIALEFMRQYPASIDAIVLHGKAKMENRRFQEAIDVFEKAKQNEDSSDADLEQLISRCNELIGESNK